MHQLVHWQTYVHKRLYLYQQITLHLLLYLQKLQEHLYQMLCLSSYLLHHQVKIRMYEYNYHLIELVLC